MSSEVWNVIFYEEAEGDNNVSLSPEFAASALVNALHDSPFRSANVQRCFLGTHTIAKQAISTWLATHSPQNHSRGVPLTRFHLLWVHGILGTGKTTLMQTLADALLPPPFTSVSLSDDANEGPPTYLTAEFGSIAVQYGGTAMFLSRENQLTDASKLFLTIAYGLASRLPPLAAFVQSAFDANTDLFRNVPHLSMKEQAESLIFKPIQAWVAAEDGDVDVDLLVIIDGLDECDDRKMQTDVVEIVRDVFTKRVEGVRWSWIFSTKTNARFREVFVGGSAAVSPKADEIVISLATEEEMDAFLDCGFAHIRATHPAFPVAIDAGGPTSIPSDHLADEEWPTSQEKAATKWQSAGLYAAGASILNYIANPDDDPRARVHLTNSFIGSQYPSPDHPFSALDKTYRNALSQIPAASVPAAKRILGAISCLQPSSRDQKPPTISQIATLFGVRPDEIQQSLKSLHWVVSVPNKLTSKRNSQMSRLSAGDGELKYHHSTFDHFLRAPSRSLNWALNLEAVHLDLARCCLKNLASGQSSFAIKRWYIDCWRTGEDSEAAMGLLPDLFEFDYSILGDHAIVDRYFVEWLLRLQESTMSEYQLLNPGPLVQLRASQHPGYGNEPGFDAEPSSSSSNTNSENDKREKKLPPRRSYILGIEPSKQVYLVPFYDEKVQHRTDVGLVVGPGLKQWDWIRGFRVLPRDTVENQEIDETGADETANQELRDDGAQRPSQPSQKDDDEGLYV